jgi:hypothetical protein
MTRTHRLALAVLAAAALAFGIASLAHAQKPGSDCIVKVGEYRDLTFLRQLKIGAAAFVNPTLFDTSALAYKFDPRSFVKKVPPDSVLRDVLSGRLALAGQSKSGYIVFGSDTKEFDGLITTLKKKGAEWDDVSWLDEYVFVSPKDEIFGIPALGSIVSWDATKPVLAGSSADCAPSAK